MKIRSVIWTEIQMFVTWKLVDMMSMIFRWKGFWDKNRIGQVRKPWNFPMLNSKFSRKFKFYISQPKFWLNSVSRSPSNRQLAISGSLSKRLELINGNWHLTAKNGIIGKDFLYTFRCILLSGSADIRVDKQCCQFNPCIWTISGST